MWRWQGQILWMFKQSKRSIIDSILMKDDSILKKASHGEDYQLTMVQFLSTILRFIKTLQAPKNGWISSQTKKTSKGFTNICTFCSSTWIHPTISLNQSIFYWESLCVRKFLSNTGESCVAKVAAVVDIKSGSHRDVKWFSNVGNFVMEIGSRNIG